MSRTTPIFLRSPRNRLQEILHLHGTNKVNKEMYTRLFLPASTRILRSRLLTVGMREEAKEVTNENPVGVNIFHNAKPFIGSLR